MRIFLLFSARLSISRIDDKITCLALSPLPSPLSPLHTTPLTPSVAFVILPSQRGLPVVIRKKTTIFDRNAVVLWTTVYMQDIVHQLRKEGYRVIDEDIKHLSPARYGHVNPYGNYEFNVYVELNRTKLRPLQDVTLKFPSSKKLNIIIFF